MVHRLTTSDSVRKLVNDLPGGEATFGPRAPEGHGVQQHSRFYGSLFRDEKFAGHQVLLELQDLAPGNRPARFYERSLMEYPPTPVCQAKTRAHRAHRGFSSRIQFRSDCPSNISFKILLAYEPRFSELESGQFSLWSPYPPNPVLMGFRAFLASLPFPSLTRAYCSSSSEGMRSSTLHPLIAAASFREASIMNDDKERLAM